MKQVAELEGAELDAAVAKALGWVTYPDDVKGRNNWYLGREYMACITDFQPSKYWSQGGPIIERERISIAQEYEGGWVAGLPMSSAAEFPRGFKGSTALLAAMRALVAARRAG